MTSQKRKIGDIGEKIAEKHLVKHNFKILARNYQKKWGEIDIIAKKGDTIHFIEVKSKTVKFQELDRGYDPEENVQYWKVKRILRAIQSYLSEKGLPEETKWQIDIIAVFLDFDRRKSKLRITEDISM